MKFIKALIQTLVTFSALFIISSFTLCSGQIKKKLPWTFQKSKLQSVWYQDFDSDGYGNDAVKAKQKSCPFGYVSNNTDCNDSNFSIHPAAAEVWNGIDDNCEGSTDEGLVADLTAWSSEKQLTNALATATAINISYQGGMISRDVTIPTYVSLVQDLHIPSIEFPTGGTANLAHVIPGKPNMLNAGNGYNDPSADCSISQGVFCRDFRLYGKPYDFYCAQDSLRKIVGSDGVILANVMTGTIDELFWKIDRLAATGQTTIYIQYGAEEDLPKNQIYYSNSGAVYGEKVKAWRSQVDAKYPGKKFFHILDVYPVWDESKSGQLWNTQLSSVVKQSDGFCVRAYYHLHLMVTLSGELNHDLDQINYAISERVPEITASWESSAFAGYPIYVNQYSSSDYGPGGVPNKGTFLTACFTTLFLQYMADYNRDHGLTFIGASYQTLKDLVENPGKVDYQMMSVLYNLYHGNRYMLSIDGLPGSNVCGAVQDGIYSFVVLNRTQSQIPLPVNISLDGRHVTLQVQYSQCVYADGYLSGSVIPYSLEGSIKALSINYLEVK